MNLIFTNSIAYAQQQFVAPYTPPTINVPKTPGTYGARELDWNVSDSGSISWNIPFSIPASRQMQISLALNYFPVSSIGEGGNFWSLNIPKIQIDKKRGKTNYLTATNCSQSLADNIFISSTQMIPLGNGTWVSQGNSGQDVLKCGENGSFVLYLNDGNIHEYGTTNEAKIQTPDGKINTWYLTKVRTFAGKGEINYNYIKPQFTAVELNLANTKEHREGFLGKPIFYSLPLLNLVQSDDVSVQLNYEYNNFIQPDFSFGIPQVSAQRISKVTVYKNLKQLNKYVFEYEKSDLAGRLISVVMYGQTDNAKHPKTVFKYNAKSFFKDSKLSLNKFSQYSFKNRSNYHEIGKDSLFLDIHGKGYPSLISREYFSGKLYLTYKDYDFKNLFQEETMKQKSLPETKTGKIILSEGVAKWQKWFYISKVKFADMDGHGAQDWVDFNDYNHIPLVYFNDYKKDKDDNVVIQRVAKFKAEDIRFLTQCDYANIQLMHINNDGKSDLFCIRSGAGKAYILLNKGMTPYTGSDAKPGQFIMEFEKIVLTLPLESSIYFNPDKMRIVDWNNDGLSDILNDSSGDLVVYLNNGKFSQGIYTEAAFTPTTLGRIRNLEPSNLKNINIVDIFGNGLPSLIAPKSYGFKILVNNGVSNKLTEVDVYTGRGYVNTENFQVIDLIGSGKPIVVSQYPDSLKYTFLNLDLPSFPNLLSSVLTEDGRYIKINYSTPLKELHETLTFETDPEIINQAQNNFILPVIFPLVKQISTSDGFNPVQITRYAYRSPAYDKKLAKFLAFGLTRSLKVGDETQAGQLTENRFLSGRRYLSESTQYYHELLKTNSSVFSSEINALDQNTAVKCNVSTQNEKENEWCTQLAGYKYSTKVGAALNANSAFSGDFSEKENIFIAQKTVSAKQMESHLLRGLGVIPINQYFLASILTMSETEKIIGKNYLGNNAESLKIKYNTYDEFNRLHTVTDLSNTSQGEKSSTTTLEYFCPATHSENLAIFCNKVSKVTLSSTSHAPQMSYQYHYQTQTGLLYQHDKTNHLGVSTKQWAIQEFDFYGRPKVYQSTTGDKQIFTWSETGIELLSVTDRYGIKNSATYDELGNLTRLESTRGTIKGFEYDEFSRLVKLYKNKTTPGTIIKTNSAESENLIKKVTTFISDFVKSKNNEKKYFHIKIPNLNYDKELLETESYEYSFPKLSTVVGKSTLDIQQFMDSLEENQNKSAEFSILNDYNLEKLPSLNGQNINFGFVSIYNRNRADEKLTLNKKIWLSGKDEAIFEASRLDANRFSLGNKSARNSLGSVFKDYVNSEISEEQVLNNILPRIQFGLNQTLNHEKAILKNKTTFFFDGSIKTVEFPDGQILENKVGANFREVISPEGRKTRSVYNEVGELVRIEKGLTSQGNTTEITHILDMEYDAFHRLIKVADNDGLVAEQQFLANGFPSYIANTRLGIIKHFYDDYDRIIQTNTCERNTVPEECIKTSANLLAEKNTIYDTYDRISEIVSTKYNKLNKTNAVDKILYSYGEEISQPASLGLLKSTSVIAKSQLGTSKNIQQYFLNEEGVVNSQILDLYFGQDSNEVNISQYIVDKEFNLAGNIEKVSSIGGFPNEKNIQLLAKNVSGYELKYILGNNNLSNLKFINQDKVISTPVENIYFNNQGYLTQIQFENNLKLQTEWHLQKQIPTAIWLGESQNIPQKLSDISSANSLFHHGWEYDKDYLITTSKDLSANKYDNIYHPSSTFKYDFFGRLSETKGLWGEINYQYSASGKIKKVTRSGNFIASRVSANLNQLIDNYEYSNSESSSLDGLLVSIISTDGKESIKQFYNHDSSGYREFGVAPTLAVLNKQSSESWKTPDSIPMQKYIWNGNGQLQAVYSAKHVDKNVIYNELLSYRMFNDKGHLIAEFDSVELEEVINASKGTVEKPQVKTLTHPRFVKVTDNIYFERDELHFNINLGEFATLSLITRNPILNATSPETISDTSAQFRKELRIKDVVGSIAAVIDIDTKKVVEKNVTEPFGLARDLPLLSNANFENTQNSTQRIDSQFFTSIQNNSRATWPKKSFEMFNASSESNSQGMRATEQFATGKFSAQSGLHTMGVRSYDPARGLWLSPDVYIGQSLERMLQNPDDSNLFQYSGNNPVIMNDPSGENIIIKTAIKVVRTGNLIQSTYDSVDSVRRHATTIIDPNTNLTEKMQATSDLIGDFLPVNADDLYAAADFIQSVLAVDQSVPVNTVLPESKIETATEVEAKSKQKDPEHHICTNKNDKSPRAGGPWTPRFRAMFEKAGLDMDKGPENTVRVPGHKGPHTFEYHNEIYTRLKEVTKGLDGEEYTKAFTKELENIKKEIVTPGTNLNNLVTKKDSNGNSTVKSKENSGGPKIDRTKR
ncbi:AHH domain-containing protein [Pigmentibacter ruber]|uniref:AHH domain-containing protein n=1 Tax=Pigmentibacter ruber TaxID=2683196 RepID=UPI00131B0039|nr:AHH domain-containing protein [Pigmentibacter ruber]